MPGDVDGDTDCDSADYIYLDAYLKKSGSAPPYPVFRADVNCDGVINGSDYTYLYGYITGLLQAPPKCCYWIYTDTTATYYVYSGNQVIAEYDEGGNLLDNYIYGNGLNPIAKYNPTDGKRFYMRDIRGSVVTVTDSTGSLKTSYDYYPFGALFTVSGSHDRYKYTHKEIDDGYNVGLYYYGARYYDARLGRFTSPDPIRGYYNPYSYVRNNPIYYIDPSGEWGVIVYYLAVAAVWCLTNPVLCRAVGNTLFRLADEYGDDVTDAIGAGAGWLWDNFPTSGDFPYDFSNGAPCLDCQ